MDAIILAGGLPEASAPLYSLTQGRPKAFLEVGGETMLDRVLRALEEAPSITRIWIVGLEYSSSRSRAIFCLPDQGGLFSNGMFALKEAAKYDPTARQFLLTSSDIPALRGEMIEWLVARTQQSEDDVFYNVIAREIMEQRFPGSGRTYVRLKDQEVCGGDVVVVSRRMIHEKEELWNRIFSARKNPLRLATMIGFRTLFLLLFRRLTLTMAVSLVSQRLGIRGHVLLCPYAEMGMDVDKLAQWEILDRDLRK